LISSAAAALMQDLAEFSQEPFIVGKRD
jgi:hypothetical protein